MYAARKGGNYYSALIWNRTSYVAVGWHPPRRCSLTHSGRLFNLKKMRNFSGSHQEGRKLPPRKSLVWQYETLKNWLSNFATLHFFNFTYIIVFFFAISIILAERCVMHRFIWMQFVICASVTHNMCRRRADESRQDHANVVSRRKMCFSLWKCGELECCWLPNCERRHGCWDCDLKCMRLLHARLMT